MRLAMGFEWVLFRLLLGPKRKCRHFQCCGEVRQIPPHSGGLSHAQRPPRQRLRSGPPLGSKPERLSMIGCEFTFLLIKAVQIVK
jgi:hypothetical protein